MFTYNLGSLEEDIMAFIWERDSGTTVRQVNSHLERTRKIAYTTVMTVMTRLVDKGFLTRKRQGRAFVYAPQKTREQAAKGMVSSVFDKLVNQFGEEAVVAFSDELKKVSKKNSR